LQQASQPKTARSQLDSERNQEGHDDMLELDFLSDEIESQYPDFTDFSKLEDKIMSQFVDLLSDSKVPMLDTIDLFRCTEKKDMPQDFNINNVSLQDF
jgi:hypothetical protein